MSLRRRVNLTVTVVVALAVALAAVLCYVVVARQLRGQVDDQLHLIASPGTPRAGIAVRADPPREFGRRVFPRQPGPREGGPGIYFMAINAAGKATAPQGQAIRVPVDPTDRAVAAGRLRRVLRDRVVDGVHLRVVTFHLARGGALQAARPVESIDRVLSRLRLVLLLVCAGGIALATLLARLVARRLVAPIAEVADAAAHVGETDDLGRRIAVRSSDEVGQLAARFNVMLDRLSASRDALDASARSQRRLVADASHELRTPITSLRTNIEVLLADGELDTTSRTRLLDDVREQTEELGALVSDLIELARGDEPPVERDDVRLDQLATEAVARARRHAPAQTITLAAEPVMVEGAPDRLGRALNNLLDNAARHSGSGGLVEVTVGERGIAVRDHGEGIDPEDLPHLFDRFYRGAGARGRLGSGLGLAIVRQTAEQHGGTVRAENAEGGGARFVLELPARAVADPGASCSVLRSRSGNPEVEAVDLIA